jgi:dipeptidyl aminopeptidase/acylaminoacyl peptidase
MSGDVSDETGARSLHAQLAHGLLHGRSSVGEPAVAPDGRRVAFVVATSDVDRNRTVRRVWIDDRPVTGGDHDTGPAWAPDGRSLAFASRRSEKKGESTLHVMPVDGPGEVRTVCTMPDGIAHPTFSPDGRWIAFLSRTQHPRYRCEDESWQPPRKVERFLSRLNGEGWIADRPQHVYVVAADGTGTPRNLTPGEFQHDGISWLADSTAVVTSAERHETWDRDLASDLYVVPLDGEIRCLTGHDGTCAHPSVSPAGDRVAFIGSPDPLTYPQNMKIGIVPIEGGPTAAGDVLWASAGLDRTFDTTAGPRPPVWTGDGELLATAEDRGATHLHRVDASGERAPVPLTTGTFTVAGFDAAGGTIATIRSSVDRTPELWVGDVRRTHVGDELSTRLVGWERFRVPTTDGTDEIDCWIMRPAGFEPAATYPVLLNVHGGPHTQYGECFFDEAQMQAAAGFVVVLGNPRGSSGRHTGWGQSILGERHPTAPGRGWGSVDVEDVLAIIDGALDRYEFCDRDRVGMLGGSYGGYVATWLAGRHPERFRGICSERAVNNLVSEEWSSDIATFFRSEHGQSHVDDVDAYASRSPVAFVRDIDTPMLLIHSEDDLRCPIVQAEELWVALRLLGKDVDFYRFPGEDHELSRSGSPVHRMQRAEIILDWFADKLAPR